MLPDGKLTPYAALFPAHWARRWGSPWLPPKLKAANAVIRSPLRHSREFGSSAVLVQACRLQNDLSTFKSFVCMNVLVYRGNGTFLKPFTGSSTKLRNARSGQN